MPRYYFDIHDQHGDLRDDEGLELDDLHAAELIARRTLGGLVQDALRDTGDGDVSITIRDGNEGPILIRVKLETKSGVQAD